MAQALPYIMMGASALAQPKRERMEYGMMPEAPWQSGARGQLQTMTQQPYSPSRETLQVKDYLANMLGGGYDPATSPYYQATREELSRQGKESMTGLNRQLQAGGGIYGGRSDLARANLLARTQGIQAQTLGQLTESERGRQMRAAPMLAGLGREEQEYMNQIAQYLSVLLGYQPTMAPKYQYSQSSLNQLSPLFAYMAGQGKGPVTSSTRNIFQPSFSGGGGGSELADPTLRLDY